MKIVIPMSGFGERFRRVGYEKPKPLIDVEGLCMIQHVVNMFSKDDDFIFICNTEHLKNKSYDMEKILISCSPNCHIIPIEPHKLGPIHAILQAQDLINSEEEVLVNYCDFSCYWSWENFKTFLNINNYDGVIPAYKGFHPHSLGSTNYAYMKENLGTVLDIQEKKPFTNNRMEEYASSGTYYFANASLMFEAFSYVVENDLNVNGEFYVSLAYKYLIRSNKKIALYPLEYFMQWGTPQDLIEFKGWHQSFTKIIKNASNYNTFYTNEESLIIPMAGNGKRFLDEGYKLIKPLIPVSGKPMFVQAVQDLPSFKNIVFVIRSDMVEKEKIIKTINQYYPDAFIKILPEITKGQACTALEGIDLISKELKKSPGYITISACDNGSIYDLDTLQKIKNDKNVDIIIWGAKNHPHALRNPNMYGWIKEDKNGKIIKISVKKPISEDLKESIVIGTFSFRNQNIYRRIVKSLISRGGTVNGEYYIDSCINDAIKLGLNCYLFEVEHFLCWGTPDDLKTFEYWQSCFDKWNYHIYDINSDPHISDN